MKSFILHKLLLMNMAIKQRRLSYVEHIGVRCTQHFSGKLEGNEPFVKPRRKKVKLSRLLAM